MARWIFYGFILLFVEILFIVPIANLIWLDFVDKLVPQDSIKFLELSNLETRWTIPFGLHLLHVGKNNFYPESKLRTDIPYELTLRFGLFCTSEVPINSAILEIDKVETRISLACFKDTSEASKRFGRLDSLASIVKKEYVNDFEFIFPIHPKKGTMSIEIRNHDDITLDYAHVQISMEYKGFRRFLTRLPKTSHFLGAIVFTILISFCFFLSFAFVFGYITVIN